MSQYRVIMADIGYIEVKINICPLFQGVWMIKNIDGGIKKVNTIYIGTQKAQLYCV